MCKLTNLKVQYPMWKSIKPQKDSTLKTNKPISLNFIQHPHKINYIQTNPSNLKINFNLSELCS